MNFTSLHNNCSALDRVSCQYSTIGHWDTVAFCTWHPAWGHPYKKGVIVDQLLPTTVPVYSHASWSFMRTSYITAPSQRSSVFPQHLSNLAQTLATSSTAIQSKTKHAAWLLIIFLQNCECRKQQWLKPLTFLSLMKLRQKGGLPQSRHSFAEEWIAKIPSHKTPPSQKCVKV